MRCRSWKTWLQSIRKIPSLVTRNQRKPPSFYVRYDWDSVSCNSTTFSMSSLEKETCGDSAIDVSSDFSSVNRGPPSNGQNAHIDYLRSSALATITDEVSKSTDCLMDNQQRMKKRQRSYEMLDVPDVDDGGNIIREAEKLEKPPRVRKRSKSISSLTSHQILSLSASLPPSNQPLRVTPTITVDEWDRAKSGTYPRTQNQLKPLPRRRLLAPISNIFGRRIERSRSRFVYVFIV